MPFLVKPVFSKRTIITICLIFIFVVNIFERMSIWFTLLYFKPQRVNLEVSFAVSYHFPIVFKFIWAITFLTFCSIYVAYKSGVIPLLAVLALWNAMVYISFFDHSNMMIYIKGPVNEILCFCTILRILNVNSDYGHVGFGRSFEYTRAEC